MNSELALHPSPTASPSFEVTVGAPLNVLLRRYSDAFEAPIQALEQNACGHWQLDSELAFGGGSFGGAEHEQHVDLQLAVA
jgi:hypothetical protein